MAVTLKGALGKPVLGTQMPGSQSSEPTWGGGGGLPQHTLMRVQITSVHSFTLGDG